MALGCWPVTRLVTASDQAGYGQGGPGVRSVTTTDQTSGQSQSPHQTIHPVSHSHHNRPYIQSVTTTDQTSSQSPQQTRHPFSHSHHIRPYIQSVTTTDQTSGQSQSPHQTRHPVSHHIRPVIYPVTVPATPYNRKKETLPDPLHCADQPVAGGSVISETGCSCWVKGLN